MQFFYQCYQQTYLKRSGHGGYLTSEFFHGLLSDMPKKLMLVVAERFVQGEPENSTGDEQKNLEIKQKSIAAALFLHDKDGLYGRYWGALEDVSGLHFEVCYYQGIEFCIENNIPLFNPGTQGEHKILRGFEPTLCYSNHVMAEPAFDEAVKDFLKRETPHIIEYFTQSESLLPFRQETAED
jgi:predicted N-acyltransferase